ncbi:MAG: mandelate racemase/muconate lactonizing enzyme family protein [Chloroflexi bacterium]|nr:mandelate racemase/muconate lactonizing enzyme family protein [Chloroflexota bacterium]
MKIVDVQAIPLAIPLAPATPPSPWGQRMRRQVVVRVLSDEGLVGLGEGFAMGGTTPLVSAIVHTLRPLLLGQDPTRIESLTDRLLRATTGLGRRGTGLYAVSAVEIALWDLLGKLRNAPLYDLLGGLTRPSMRAYASLLRYSTPADVAAACRSWAARGFTYLKLHQTDVASVHVAREAVGADVGLMLDPNAPWTPAEALSMAKALEPFGLTWLEEPIWPPEDYDALAELRTRTRIPIATGENEGTVYGFRDLLAKRPADVIQPSIVKAGGIAEMKRIATLATVAGVPVAPHSFYIGPGLAATLHVAATFAGDALVELPAFEYEPPLLIEPIAATDGCVRPPDGPGLGVSLDEEVLQRYRAPDWPD